MTTVMMESPVICEKTEMEDDVKVLIEKKLEAFDNAIEGHEFLEIDGVIEGSTHQESSFKIINHEMEDAFSISLDAVIRQDLDYIIKSLETGVTTRLYGVTRIVGYYSRISNWNKSKIGELHDRHMGRYSVK